MWQEYLEVVPKNPVPIAHPMSPNYTSTWLPAPLYAATPPSVLGESAQEKKCNQCRRWLLPEETVSRHDDLMGHLTEISPFCRSFRGKLYLGALWNASSVSDLSYAGIDTVVPMAVETSTKLFPNTLKYKIQWLWYDDDEYVLPDLCSIMDWLFSPKEQESRNVLIHCFQGRSRSATVVLAAMIYQRYVDMSKAKSGTTKTEANETAREARDATEAKAAMTNSSPSTAAAAAAATAATAATAVTAATAATGNRIYESAYNELQAVRTCIRPNISYHHQLVLWDNVLSSVGIWPMTVLTTMYDYLGKRRDRFLAEYDVDQTAASSRM